MMVLTIVLAVAAMGSLFLGRVVFGTVRIVVRLLGILLLLGAIAAAVGLLHSWWS